MLPAETAASLADALALWRQVHGLLRLTVEGRFDERKAPRGLKLLLAAATNARDVRDLKARMRHAAEQVRRHFHEIIEQSAAGAAATHSEGEARPWR